MKYMYDLFRFMHHAMCKIDYNVHCCGIFLFLSSVKLGIGQIMCW